MRGYRQFVCLRKIQKTGPGAATSKLKQRELFEEETKNKN